MKGYKMNSGIALIAKERQEQIEKHGRTVDHDLKVNDNEQLARAAGHLIAAEWNEGMNIDYVTPDGWDKEIFLRMMNKPYQERLKIAGALIAAELDRLQASNSAFLLYDRCHLHQFWMGVFRNISRLFKGGGYA